jgi:hypothetical protein
MSNWSLPASGNYADYVFQLFGVGTSVLIYPDGQLAVADWRDATSPAQPCFLPLPATSASSNVLVRIQRDASQMQLSCEIWNVDSSGYAQDALPINSFNTWTVSGGQLGSATVQAQLGFLRVFTSLVAENSQPPATAETGNWSDWKFDGTLNDDSGNQHNGSVAAGQAAYVSTPGQQTVAALITSVGAPYWADVPSVRAGFPVQLDGTRSYSMNDQSASVTYQWSQTGGPTTVLWDNPALAQPTIQGLIFGSYTFQLVVKDVAGNNATAVQEIGAVATDNNGVVVYPDSRLDALLGPSMMFGANPWQWFDVRDSAVFTQWTNNYQINSGPWELETDQSSIAGVPRSGTVYVAQGSNTMYGVGTNFSQVFCGGVVGGPASSVAWIMPQTHTLGAGSAPDNYGRVVATCVSDTELTFADGWTWDQPTISSPGAPWGTFGLCSTCGPWASTSGANYNLNFYDSALAHYALYYRSGWSSAQKSASWLADRWYYSPAANEWGMITPRDLSMTSAVLHATFDAPTYSVWPTLEREIANCYYVPGSPVNTPIIDPRETAYCQLYTAWQALFDPNPAAAATARSNLVDYYNSTWAPLSQGGQQQPNGNYINDGIDGDTTYTFQMTQGSDVATVSPALLNSGSPPPALPQNYCNTVYASGLTSGGTISLAADGVTVTGYNTADLSVTAPNGAGMYVGLSGTLNGNPWTMISQVASSPAPTANTMTLLYPWRGDPGSVSPTKWAIWSSLNSYAEMFFAATDQYNNLINPPALDTDSFYWCSVAGPTTIRLSTVYTGNTSGANGPYRRPTWQNLTGRGSQPFMMGIIAWALNTSAKALDGYNATVAAQYRASANAVTDWITTYGTSPSTHGLYYGDTEFSNCRNLTILPAYDCAQLASGTGAASPSSNERAYLPEVMNAYASKYLNTMSSADQATGDATYNYQWAVPGYAVPSGFASDGNWAQLVDPCCVVSTKGYGQVYGMGQGHQWPAARLGGVSPPSPLAVPVTIYLADAGAASAQVLVTQPSSAQQQYTCSASPCTVQVDQRQGAHWAQVQYLSVTGAVISTEPPILLGQQAAPAAATTTTAANATAVYSAGSQAVTLSATVTSTAGTVNAGIVTFTLQGTQVVSGTVTNGAATAVCTLPAGTAAGIYPISAVYNGGGGFSGSSGTSSLTVNLPPSATTTTTAANATTTFSGSSQAVALSATVTSTAGTVNAGTVTFTVRGTQVISGTVTNGAASGVYTLPAGSAVGSYPISAVYNGGGGFGGSSGTSSLTVNSSSTSTTAANATATYSASGQPVTLSATVTSTAGAVNEGTVTFTVLEFVAAPIDPPGTTNTIQVVYGTPVTSGTVTNGAAAAVYTLPAGAAVGCYTISAVYNDTANFATSADSTHTLTVNGTGSGGCGYSYARAITISHLQVPNTDQSNFPVLFSTTDALLKSAGNGGHVASASGYDLIFASDSGCTTKLNYEVESWSATSGQYIAWVQVPTVSHTSDTTIYLCYGNSAITSDQSNKTAVWDRYYTMVQHFPNGTTLTARDSTSNGVNGTITGATATSGLIGGAAEFTGNTTYITFPGSSALDTALDSQAWSISVWFYLDAVTDYTQIFGGIPYGNNVQGMGPNIGQCGAGRFWIISEEEVCVASTANPSAGAWHHVVWTYSNANSNLNSLYMDGVLAATGTLNFYANNGGASAVYGVSGNTASVGAGINGAIDETEVSNIARSADWIATEYNNQRSPATFYSVGPETRGP